jgi:hypothetical protein
MLNVFFEHLEHTILRLVPFFKFFFGPKNCIFGAFFKALHNALIFLLQILKIFLLFF